MARRRVVNFGLPSETADLAEHILRQLPGLGFGSRADVIKAAVRDYYLRLVSEKVLSPAAFGPGYAQRHAPPKTKTGGR